MTVFARQCTAILDIDEDAADKIFKMIVSAMLTEYGQAKTEAALDFAFDRISKEVKARGPRAWCEMDAAIWIEIRYPELGKK